MAVLKKKKTIKKKVVVKKKARLDSRLDSAKRAARRVKTVKSKTIKKKKVVKKTTKKSPVSKFKKTTPLDLKRSNKNPIIKPEDNIYWESKATFNPTAFYHDGKVHIIYRAIGNSDNSVLGYAGSKDGFTISDRFSIPVYHHFLQQNRNQPFLSYSSGGGWGGGCEDPRITLIGDKVYMLYTAFDGWNSVRISLTSIKLNDFLSKYWNWKMPVLISPPNEIHKNWALFPEKINGKYAILHNISPEILVDYFDSLDELNGYKFVKSVRREEKEKDVGKTGIRGIGPAPIKTKFGWLVLYHKTEAHDPGKYKLWAMLLDLKNPTKILYCGNQPILEPDEWYENEGYKSGVVYSCGAVIKDGMLFVYYGGADKVSCVATANLNEFLKELMSQKVSKLKNKKLKI